MAAALLSALGVLTAAAALAAVAEKEPRLFFLGVDGASWKVIGRLIEAGELPHFERLTREGSYMSHFETMESTDSPVVWTTVATGRSAEDHGITEYTETLPNGRQVPITSNSRKVKAIWEVASENDVSVGVTGWWASWPAEVVKGYIISDHANPIFNDYRLEDGYIWTADPERLELMSRDFYPTDLGARLHSRWLNKNTFDYEDFARRSKLSPAQIQLMQDAAWNKRSLYSLLKTFYGVDFPLFNAAMQLYQEKSTQLTMLYIRGPDPVQHYGWDLVEPEFYASPSKHLERDRGVIEGVYRYVDSFLGELLAVLDEETWLIVASDHGSEPRPDADQPGTSGRPGFHSRAAKGVLFVRGPHVRMGHRLDRGDPRDLMPTMAWLMGLPISEEMVGSALVEAFDPDFAAGRESLRVESYGDRAPGTSEPSAADDAMLESLRALGYIE